MNISFTISPFIGGVSLSQQYDWDEGLRNAANYLYRLCNYYVFEASGIMAANSGVTIYNPNTGQQLLGKVTVNYQFIVGSIDNPMDVTNTYFTITDPRIIAGTFNMYIDRDQDVQNIPTQVSYIPIYSPNSIRVTNNQPLQPGQIVRYSYEKGGSVSSGTLASQETLYYTFPSDASSKVFSELVGIPLSQLRLVFRSGTVVRPVTGTTTDSTQIQYDGTTGTFTPPTGDVFSQDSNLTVDYVA